jgi:hypothetical protein
VLKRGNARGANRRSPAEMLVDRANMLTLTVPEMTILVGGMRVLNANAGQSEHGVFTDQPGTLSNDFFVNLLDMSTQCSKSSTSEGVYGGRDRGTGELKWTATPVDLAIDPCRHSRVTLVSGWRMYFSVNITVLLVPGSACNRQASLACFSSFIGFDTWLLMSRDLAKM